MANTYSIEISIDNNTLNKLENQSLRIYKGVAGSVGDGFCALWYTTSQFSSTMNIQWEETYGGYVSNQLMPSPPISPGAFIIQSNIIQSMRLGELMTVNDKGTTGITTNGAAGEINIANNGTKEWTCGISQSINNTPSPLCSIPLNGNDYCNITPLEKILLNFDEGVFQTGTVIEKAWIKSIVIDFSSTDETQLSVSYNIDKGWDAQSAVWAQLYTTPIDIADTLNEPEARKQSA